MTVNSGVTVDGDVHTQRTLEMDTGTVGGDVYANEGVVIDDDSGSDTVVGEIHANGPADIDAGVFTNATYVNGSFSADEANFEDEVHVAGTATVDGASFDDDLYVDGDVTTLAGSDSDPTDVEGDVHVTGDAEISEVTIQGDLFVEGELTCDDESDVRGDLHVEDADTSSECRSSDGTASPTLPVSPDAPAGTQAPDEPVIDPPTVELPDDEAFDEVPDECREGGDPNGDAIVIDSRTCQLDPGTYNVSRLDVDGDDPHTVNLDLRTQGTAETVELYVGGDVSVAEDARIRTGDSGHTNATEFELNGYDESASVDVSSNVTGVINAPGTTVDFDSGAHVFGAVIAEDVSADGGGGVHYDRALSGRTVGDGGGDPTTIRYLHVTTNEVTMED